ncbi:MAG: peptide deformylase [Candidatus Melainabacteria bacterium]|nr:peptide deformylase [Candidatus Melainabacteria bacterium]
MAVKKILRYGDPVLRKKAEKVHKISAKIKQLVQDLFDTMYAAENGVGLAAPQIGVSKRVFVLDCGTDEDPLPPMVFINPVIVRREGAVLSREGCLSFPDVYTDVKRYGNITVRFTDLSGRPKELTVEAGTLLNRAIQHELDHLDGVLFVDHVVYREEVEQALKEQELPPIEPERILQEPELDAVLATPLLSSSSLSSKE